VKVTAVVLAGSRPGRDAFAEQFGTDLKALIQIGGEPMVRRPVRALLDSKNIGKILVLSQSPERIGAVVPADERIEVRSSEGSIAETMLRLIDDPSVSWPMLVTTADHALLDAKTIDEFCAGAASADVAIGVVEKSKLMGRFPEAKRTWQTFRGGAFTGANLFMLRSPDVRRAVELWRSVEQDRKKALRVVAVLGPVTLMLTALRLISLDEVLGQLGDRLRLSIKAVRLSNPLAGVDVDKAEDHALVEAVLRGEA
jgi:GTP:adenosylcobinamide-phosphate guanylyltransferase